MSRKTNSYLKKIDKLFEKKKIKPLVKIMKTCKEKYIQEVALDKVLEIGEFDEYVIKEIVGLLDNHNYTYLQWKLVPAISSLRKSADKYLFKYLSYVRVKKPKKDEARGLETDIRNQAFKLMSIDSLLINTLFENCSHENKNVRWDSLNFLDLTLRKKLWKSINRTYLLPVF